jgi:hypothetical protein
MTIHKGDPITLFGEHMRRLSEDQRTMAEVQWRRRTIAKAEQKSVDALPLFSDEKHQRELF